MKSEDDNTSDAFIKQSFHGMLQHYLEKFRKMFLAMEYVSCGNKILDELYENAHIQGMQPTLYHVNLTYH